MEIGTISNWLIKEGDEFKRGQIIAEVDSDKTTVELPALEDGTLTKIIFNEGDEMNVGEDIAIFNSIFAFKIINNEPCKGCFSCTYFTIKKNNITWFYYFRNNF